MTSDDLAKALAVLAEHAPRLRSAGVLELSVGDVRAVLANAEPATSDDDDDDESEGDDRRPALHDPATFGRRGGVPRRRDLHPDDD